MKHLLLLLLLSLSFNAFAGSDGAEEKPYSLGIGTYYTNIAFSGFADDDLFGTAFTFGYAVSNSVLLRGTLFSLEHDDISAIESTGYDLLAYYGNGLASQGFKWYVGGGLFKDTWDVAGFDTSFSGLQLGGGLGYNWDSISLDVVLNIRDSSDYEDFINIPLGTSFSATAASSSLLLSYRF